MTPSDIDINLVISRMFEKMDSMSSKIDNLCDRITKMEMAVSSHFKDVESGKNRKKVATEWKERKFYILIAVMGVLFAAYSTFF